MGDVESSKTLEETLQQSRESDNFLGSKHQRYIMAPDTSCAKVHDIHS